MTGRLFTSRMQVMVGSTNVRLVMGDGAEGKGAGVKGVGVRRGVKDRLG